MIGAQLFGVKSTNWPQARRRPARSSQTPRLCCHWLPFDTLHICANTSQHTKTPKQWLHVTANLNQAPRIHTDNPQRLHGSSLDGPAFMPSKTPSGCTFSCISTGALLLRALVHAGWLCRVAMPGGCAGWLNVQPSCDCVRGLAPWLSFAVATTTMPTMPQPCCHA